MTFFIFLFPFHEENTLLVFQPLQVYFKGICLCSSRSYAKKMNNNLLIANWILLFLTLFPKSTSSLCHFTQPRYNPCQATLYKNFDFWVGLDWVRKVTEKLFSSATYYNFSILTWALRSLHLSWFRWVYFHPSDLGDFEKFEWPIS